MARQGKGEGLSVPPPLTPPRGSLGKRVRNMTLLWLAFGALVGAGSMPPEAGTIGLLSGAIAGMLLLPFLGSVLGLMGGQCLETLAGALWGLMVGAAAAALTADADLLLKAALGLLVGGLAGATFPGLCRLFRQHVVGLVLS